MDEPVLLKDVTGKVCVIPGYVIQDYISNNLDSIITAHSIKGTVKQAEKVLEAELCARTRHFGPLYIDNGARADQIEAFYALYRVSGGKLYPTPEEINIIVEKLKRKAQEEPLLHRLQRVWYRLNNLN